MTRKQTGFATGAGRQLIEAYGGTVLVRFEYNHFQSRIEAILTTARSGE